MLFFIFSPNGKNFCQFMAPDFPKPMFLAQIHLGLVGALAFYFSQNLHPGPWGPSRALLVLRLGPWGP